MAALQNLEVIDSPDWLPNVNIKRYIFFSPKENDPRLKTIDGMRFLELTGSMKSVMEQEIDTRQKLRQTKEVFLWADASFLDCPAGSTVKEILNDVSDNTKKFEVWRPLKYHWENTTNLQMEMNVGVSDCLKKSLKCTGRIHHIEELESHLQFWQRQLKDVSYAIRYDPFEYHLFHTPRLLTSDKDFAERLRHVTDPNLTVTEVRCDMTIWG
jgi:hypothetical protein